MIMPWYLFCPIDPYPHNICDPNNYINVGTVPPNCPNPNIYLCAIQAKDNAGKPIITPKLCNEIVMALNNRIESAHVLLRPTIHCI